MKFTFILPGRGGGGGAHSVVQETLGLRRLGLDAGIATTADSYPEFKMVYPELDARGVRHSVYSNTAELAAILDGADLAIATTATSVRPLVEALDLLGDAPPKCAYYIQDYEPLFFTPGTPEWVAARESYLALPENSLLFAKTKWLCSIVEQNHGRRVAKVSPSLDHTTYYPILESRSEPLVVSAMIRPKTPRRAPRRTVRVLEQIAAKYGERVRILTFGGTREDLDTAGLRLSERIEHAGVLSRQQVAALLRRSDLFLDLSDYQAFGRTGVEAMACGCVPMLPLLGGAAEYVQHEENGYLIDVRSDGAVLGSVDKYFNLPQAGRARLRERGIETALGYSIERAAFSEYRAFAEFLN